MSEDKQHAENLGSSVGSTVIVVAKVDTLSIVAGRVYEWTPYDDGFYARYGERPPRIREGTLTGLNGSSPTCVGYPETAIKRIEFDEYLDFL